MLTKHLKEKIVFLEGRRSSGGANADSFSSGDMALAYDNLEQWYGILELEPGAPVEEVNQAYRDLVRVWHPDRFAHDPRLQLMAQERLKGINKAYEKLQSIPSFSGSDSSHPESIVTAGKGTGKVCLRATIETVKKELGNGIEQGRYSDVYFIDYPSRGIKVSFRNRGSRVNAIFYYNNDEGFEHFSAAQVRTEKGIDWNSSPSQVSAAYGNPVENHDGKNPNGSTWRRIRYIGIDFRFINEKLVRIGVPGN